MALTEARRESLLAYCRLSELRDDPEVAVLLEAYYEAAVGYMTHAGISEPPEGTPRRAQYDLCVNYLVSDGYDQRDMVLYEGGAVDNPAFRRLIVQMKLTEPGTVSKSDTGGAYG